MDKEIRAAGWGQILMLQKQKEPSNPEGPFAGDRPNSFRYRSVSSIVSILSIPHDFEFDKDRRTGVFCNLFMGKMLYGIWYKKR